MVLRHLKELIYKEVDDIPGFCYESLKFFKITYIKSGQHQQSDPSPGHLWR